MGLFCKLFKKKKKNVIEENIQDTYVPKQGTFSPMSISKEMLEELVKQFPESDQPLIVENNGKLILTDIEGKGVKLNIPLLTIVPIPNISIDSVDIKKYYEENFGGTKEKKQIKSLDDIEGVKINVPNINVFPIPNIPKEVIEKDNK